jgi:hypothetical protein
MLPAVLLVFFAVAVLGGGDAGPPCMGHDEEWMSTIAGHCARLVPGR